LDPSVADRVTITSGTMDLGPSKGEWVPQLEVYCENQREWISLVEGTLRSEVMEDLLHLLPTVGDGDQANMRSGSVGPSA